MKAAQLTAYGPASAVKVQEVDRPHPAAGQVLIEVHASSLNPFDTTIREGRMRQAIPLNLPVTLGGDIAGVVTKVGEGVTHVAPGDQIYGQANVVAGNSGAWAEYAVTTGGQVAKMPGDNFEVAGVLPLAGVAALQGLTEHIKLTPRSKLFIQGGSGGIGSLAIQLAKHLGAYVATTATGEGAGYAKELSADIIIDYRTENFADQLHDYDAVFDTAGPAVFNDSLVVLKPGGVAVSMAAPVDEARAMELGVSAFTQATHVTTAALDQLRELVESGVMKPRIDRVFPLDDIQAAFEAREGGKVIGKIGLKIR
jgi:alcohol dehydrogenase